MLAQVRQNSKQPKVNTSWYTVGRGSAGAFKPPWAFPVFDVRLFRFDKSLFATSVCAQCNFGVYLVQLSGDVSTNGGLSSLRAWVTQKAVTRRSWAQGRNQALFAGKRSPLHPMELMVQPWLGVTASFGTPFIERQHVVCHRPSPGKRQLRVRGIQSCGTIRPQETVHIDRLRNLKGKELKRLLRSGELGCTAPNCSTSSSQIEINSIEAVAAGFGHLALLWNNTLRDVLAVPGGHVVSSTSHLVRSVPFGQARGACDVLLGVGHLQRSK